MTERQRDKGEENQSLLNRAPFQQLFSKMMCDQTPATVTGHFMSELVLNPRVYLNFSLSSLRLSGSIHHKTFAECLDISAASAVVETQGQIQIPHQTRLQLSAHFQCKKGERNDLFIPVYLNNKKERVPQ